MRDAKISRLTSYRLLQVLSPDPCVITAKATHQCRVLVREGQVHHQSLPLLGCNGVLADRQGLPVGEGVQGCDSLDGSPRRASSKPPLLLGQSANQRVGSVSVCSTSKEGIQAQSILVDGSTFVAGLADLGSELVHLLQHIRIMPLQSGGLGVHANDLGGEILEGCLVGSIEEWQLALVGVVAGQDSLVAGGVLEDVNVANKARGLFIHPSFRLRPGANGRAITVQHDVASAHLLDGWSFPASEMRLEVRHPLGDRDVVGVSIGVNLVVKRLAVVASELLPVAFSKALGLSAAKFAIGVLHARDELRSVPLEEVVRSPRGD